MLKQGPNADEVGGPARGPLMNSCVGAEALRPIESRMKSAQKYYAPQDIQDEDEWEESPTPPRHDGLGQHGDPEGPTE